MTARVNPGDDIDQIGARRVQHLCDVGEMRHTEVAARPRGFGGVDIADGDQFGTLGRQIVPGL